MSVAATETPSTVRQSGDGQFQDCFRDISFELIVLACDVRLPWNNDNRHQTLNMTYDVRLSRALSAACFFFHKYICFTSKWISCATVAVCIVNQLRQACVSAFAIRKRVELQCSSVTLTDVACSGALLPRNLCILAGNRVTTE